MGSGCGVCCYNTLLEVFVLLWLPTQESLATHTSVQTLAVGMLMIINVSSAYLSVVFNSAAY